MSKSRASNTRRKSKSNRNSQLNEVDHLSGSSVPETLPSRVPALATDLFFVAGTSLIDRANLLRSRPMVEKIVLFQSLVVEGTLLGGLDLPALFDATFDDRTGASFWHLRLGGMIGPGQFVILLATFLTADGGKCSTHELALRATLTRDLSDAGVVPVTTEIVHAPVISGIDPATGHSELFVSKPAVSLEGKWFDPLPVVRWLVGREMYHHLVPSSLLRYISNEHVASALEPQSTKSPSRGGRPKGTGFQKSDEPLAAKAIELVQRGEAKSLNEALWRLIGTDGKGAAGTALPENKVDRIARIASSIQKRP